MRPTDPSSPSFSSSLPSPSSRRGAFTLLELIVVITIIGILGTLVVMRVSHVPEDVRQTKTRTDIQTILRAAELVYLQKGSYPAALDDFADKLGGVTDAWQRPYLYELRDGLPAVGTLGSDGSEGGAGADADVWIVLPASETE